MELTNEFQVPVPIDEAWTVLTDLERIAPCVPGAHIQEVEGDDYWGRVKVTVGPITVQYKGKASFVSQDAAGHTAVLKAEGRDTRGQGSASATIRARLTPAASGTAVRVVTDLTITGRVAQLGLGAMVEVSAKLVDQFAECLERHLAGSTGSAPDLDLVEEEAGPPPGSNGHAAPVGADPPPPPATPADHDGPAPATPPAPRTSERRAVEQAEGDPVDLLAAAGVPVAKRAIPVVAGVLVILWFLRRRRRR